MFASAEAFRHVRRGGQDHSGGQQEDRHPDRVAQGDGREIMRTDTPGHQSVDEAHGGIGQLRDHHGEGKGEEGTQFAAYPSESRLSRHFRAIRTVYKRHASLRAPKRGRKPHRCSRGLE